MLKVLSSQMVVFIGLSLVTSHSQAQTGEMIELHHSGGQPTPQSEMTELHHAGSRPTPPRQRIRVPRPASDDDHATTSLQVVEQVIPGGQLPVPAAACNLNPQTVPFPQTPWTNFLANEQSSSLGHEGPAPQLQGQLRDPISEEEYRTIVEHIRTLPMGWGYAITGCMRRAHLVSRYLEANGILSRKLFVVPSTADGYLRPPAMNPPPGWNYHVTATVRVVRNGRVETMVIDPAVIAGPASAQSWVQAAGGRGCDQVAPNSPRAATIANAGNRCITYETERFNLDTADRTAALTGQPTRGAWDYMDLQNSSGMIGQMMVRQREIENTPPEARAALYNRYIRGDTGISEGGL